MKGLTRISIILSSLTIAIGYVGLFMNIASLAKAKKIEKALED